MKRMVWVRWMGSMAVSILLIGGIVVTASAGDLRRIVVFNEGILAYVQQQVVALSQSSVLHILSLVNALAIEPPAVGMEAALAFLQAHPAVQRVEDDPLIGLQGAGSDGAGSDGVFVTPAAAPPVEVYPWGIDWVGAADVQELHPWLAGNEVKVALIDTGIDRTHPDLKRNIIGGYNAMARQDPSNWRDDNGHGTHVAGTLAGRVDRQGVIGVAPRLQIYALKALDQYGTGRTSDVINALQRSPETSGLSLGASEPISCGPRSRRPSTACIN